MTLILEKISGCENKVYLESLDSDNYNCTTDIEKALKFNNYLDVNVFLNTHNLWDDFKRLKISKNCYHILKHNELDDTYLKDISPGNIITTKKINDAKHFLNEKSAQNCIEDYDLFHWHKAHLIDFIVSDGLKFVLSSHNKKFGITFYIKNEKTACFCKNEAKVFNNLNEAFDYSAKYNLSALGFGPKPLITSKTKAIDYRNHIIEEIEKFYKCYGYEKQHLLKELLDDLLQFKFKVGE